MRSFKFPGGSDRKVSASNVGDSGSIPGSGRSPGAGNGNRLQYSCLENSMDGGARWAAVHGITKCRTRLSSFTFHSTFIAVVQGRICQQGQGFQACAPRSGRRWSLLPLHLLSPDQQPSESALWGSGEVPGAGACSLQTRDRGHGKACTAGAPHRVPLGFTISAGSARTWGEGRFAGSAQHVGTPSPRELGSPAPGSAAIHPEFTSPPAPAG